MKRRSNIYLHLVNILFFLVLLSSCETTVLIEDKASRYPDLLNLTGLPEGPDDRTPYVFSDLGAWHGFGLTPDLSGTPQSGFSGPRLMDSEEWLSKSLLSFHLMAQNNEETYDLKRIRTTYYPGRLENIFKSHGVEVQITLEFITNRTALISAKLKNITNEERIFRVAWKGDLLLPEAKFGSQIDGLQIDLAITGRNALLKFSDQGNISILIDSQKKEYTAQYNEALELPPGESVDFFVTMTCTFNKDELTNEKELLNSMLVKPEKLVSKNRGRWNKYLSSALDSHTRWAENQKYKNVAVKAVETLITNWRSPAGDLFHNGLFPSYRGFTGIWSWDSWKHSAALALFAPELAKDQIRVMFDYQDEHGMVADVIYYDKSENNWRDTKPPLSTWAVWQIYNFDKRRSFLVEMLPKLEKYHQWWYKNRDNDKNGLCEYGSTDGTRIAAAWESGMDNAVRFDKAEMIQNNESSWSLDQESVDLNSYLYAEKLYLANIAEALGDFEKASDYEASAEALKTMIQTKMFDKTTGYFYDITVSDKRIITVQGPEGWIPLWTKVATNDQASEVVNIMFDKSKFSTHIPFPTLAADNSEFAPNRGYWRGPVWLDQAYFAIKGLNNYGFDQEAVEYTQQLFDRLIGLTGDGPIYENYNPMTGEVLNQPHFSWSAAHLLLLFNEIK